MSSQKLVIPTIVFVLCQVLILKLAFWQVERLAWKRDIISALDAVYALDATAIPLSFEDGENILSEDVFFRRGTLTGEFVSHKVLFLGPRQRDGMNGYHVLALFRVENGQIILVNRGWVPDGLANNDYISTSFPEALVHLTGLIRQPEKSHFFSPANVPQQNLWFGYNMKQFATYMGVDALPDVVFYVEEMDGSDLEYPSAFVEKWYPRNEHFQYMVFWFSMSAVFCLIYVLAVFRPFSRNKI